MSITVRIIAAVFFAVAASAVAPEALASGRTATGETVGHPWAGKTVAYLGDSITDPATLSGETHYWGSILKNGSE